MEIATALQKKMFTNFLDKSDTMSHFRVES